MSPRTIAMVGLGAAARHIHLPAYKKIPDLRIVGGADPLAQSGQFPFPIFRNLDEMLAATTPDIVAIVTPPDTHAPLAIKALRAGAHVFCEKPFAPTIEEARTVIDAAHRTRRWVVVNNQYRFMRGHAAAKGTIGSPEFGDLRFLAAEQTFFVTPETEAGWRGSDSRRTCKEFGTHVLDLCRFFFDEDPRRIYARMPRAGDDGGPDYLNLILLEFSRDRVAHVTLDRLSRGRHRYLDMRLDGSAGCIETHLGGGIELGAGVRGGSRRPFVHADFSMGGWARLYHGEKYRKLAADPLDLFAEATCQLTRAFLRALDDGATPPSHAADNLRTLALMLAAYESHETGKAIDLDYSALEVAPR